MTAQHLKLIGFSHDSKNGVLMRLRYITPFAPPVEIFFVGNRFRLCVDFTHASLLVKTYQKGSVQSEPHCTAFKEYYFTH